ncbi:hypothetical protein [Arthrobacter caoxuetaonis]|uniref:Uncharacterized protein n=1 Tax=Arthrobacter caoxuetaonis TaxID=2886935 RepID=A0A9X1SDZ9_9MICC|nr:hypothetical protein [Arthrobacter caoxuetaonis]MCC3299307.1 hypothetical protein [Arthrobacter caoxuetaonis]USQ59200.1 hypothetical protein NF551_16585 [Arthrobacter caoxuetaonis]
MDVITILIGILVYLVFLTATCVGAMALDVLVDPIILIGIWGTLTAGQVIFGLRALTTKKKASRGTPLAVGSLVASGFIAFAGASVAMQSPWPVICAATVLLTAGAAMMRQRHERRSLELGRTLRNPALSSTFMSAAVMIFVAAGFGVLIAVRPG